MYVRMFVTEPVSGCLVTDLRMLARLLLSQLVTTIVWCARCAYVSMRTGKVIACSTEQSFVSVEAVFQLAAQFEI